MTVAECFRGDVMPGLLLQDIITLEKIQLGIQNVGLSRHDNEVSPLFTVHSCILTNTVVECNLFYISTILNIHTMYSSCLLYTSDAADE